MNGSIECLERTTTIEEPFFNYDPLTGTEVSPGIGTSGVTVLGVDILPSELPRESSTHFGKAVSHVIEQILIAKDKATDKGVNVSRLPPGLVSNDCCTLLIDWAILTVYLFLRLNRALQLRTDDWNPTIAIYIRY